MTSKTKDEIKAFFQTGDKPTEAQFIDLTDSYVDKSGPIGQLETAASGAAAGIATFNGATPNIGTITAYDVVRAAMGITVYTTALVTNVIGNTVVTTAQASAIASDTIAAAYATTAQAQAGAIATGLMTPVLTRNAISSFAGGFVPIVTKTASNSSTIDFVNGVGGVILDGTYREYVVIINNLIPSSDGADLRLRTSSNSGSSYDDGASDYSWWNGGGISDTTTESNNNSNADTCIEIGLSQGTGNSTGENLYGRILISNPANTTVYKLIETRAKYVNSDGKFVTSDGGGVRKSISAVNAIRFLMSAGNITSGTFTLYGVM